MADAEPNPDDTGKPIASEGPAAMPGPGQPAAPQAGPARPDPPVGTPPVWKTHAATWGTHLGNGLTHVGTWLTHLGSWLAQLINRLARLVETKPSPLQTLAILAGLAVLSVLGALAFPTNAFGKACVIAFVPGLCIALGIRGTRWYRGQALNQHLTHAAQATLQLKRSVRYVDDRLAEAQRHWESGANDSALIEVVRAKTATELALGTAEHATRQWTSLAPGFDDEGSQRSITDGNIEGSVARVEDQYTLIINRGAEHGTKADMVFAVLTEGGDQIVDPETGAVIGELPTEKLRVKVVDVQPKYSRAVTFRAIAPAKRSHPALTGSAGTASGLEMPGAFDSLDESISRLLENEFGEPISVRETTAKMRIDVGDRVRQVR
ncbi:hypothetical protein [Mycobacterium asiaticum]|uniref:hypothetical protein n=1 Tax=Mycobacterium asiaticum TaxID=1790 RepID=UPI0012DB073E|nr:hypothetical protein [Mycobacterium asiaticum]